MKYILFYIILICNKKLSLVRITFFLVNFNQKLFQNFSKKKALTIFIIKFEWQDTGLTLFIIWIFFIDLVDLCSFTFFISNSLELFLRNFDKTKKKVFARIKYAKNINLNIAVSLCYILVKTPKFHNDLFKSLTKIW